MQNFSHAILQSMAINYPLLREWKLCYEKPLALIFSSKEDMKKIVNSLSRNVKIIDESTSVKSVVQYLTNINSQAVIWIPSKKTYYKSDKKKMIESMVFNAAEYGEIDGKRTFPAIFVAFVKGVPEEYEDDVHPVLIENGKICPVEAVYELIPKPTELSLVEDQIGRLKDKHVDDSMPLLAPIAFLYPRLKQQKRMQTYKRLLNCAYSMYVNSVLLKNSRRWVPLILEEFAIHFNADDAIHINIKEITEKDIEYLDYAFCIKEDSIYISEGYFKKIAEPLKELTQFSVLKRRLREEEVIICDEAGFTTKMYYRLNGKLHFARMMRFVIHPKDLANIKEKRVIL